MTIVPTRHAGRKRVLGGTPTGCSGQTAVCRSCWPECRGWLLWRATWFLRWRLGSSDGFGSPDTNAWGLVGVQALSKLITGCTIHDVTLGTTFLVWSVSKFCICFVKFRDHQVACSTKFHRSSLASLPVAGSLHDCSNNLNASAFKNERSSNSS